MKTIMTVLGLLFWAASVSGQAPDPTIKGPQQVVFTIANGASVSDPVVLKGCTPIKLVIPSAWTTANITFQQLVLGATTYGNVKDAYNAEITVTVGAVNDVVQLDPLLLLGAEAVRVRSGTKDSPVTQGGTRTGTLVCKYF